jgi:hypothetical protein
MSDNDLIKQKMKTAKKDLKVKKKEDNKKKVNISYGIILGIFEGLGTLLITKETIWYGFDMMCFVFLCSYTVYSILGTYFKIKKDLNIDNFIKAFAIVGTILLFGICYLRKFYVLAFILLIENYFIYSCADIITAFSIEETLEDRKYLKGDNLKAFNMELKKLNILAFVFAIVVALAFAGVSRYINTKDDLTVAVGSSIFFLLIWNLIVKIVLRLISKRRAKLLNCAFDFNIGEKTFKESNTFYNIDILYNSSVMFYRLSTYILTICLVFIFSKFNYGITMILTGCCTMLCRCYPNYDDGIHSTGVIRETVATIYDKDGNITGEIKK